MTVEPFSQPSPSHFFDRTLDERGRILIQTVIESESQCSMGGQEAGALAQRDEHNVTADFELLHCSCWLSDTSGSFLDLATKQCHSLLVSLTLNVSQLPRASPSCVQDVLCRTTLEHLHVVCTPFDISLSDAIVRVLGLIEWVTIKSLVLSGGNVDQRMQLWPPVAEPHLLCFDIHGTESMLQQLSHSSAF